MGETTGISWTDHTFNPWWGCFKVSPGCQHCYAESLSKRYGKDIWGPAKTTERMRTKGPWKDILKWDKQAKADRIRRKVFCASMSDFFEEHWQLDEWRDEAFDILERLEWLDVQLLTKRPENVLSMVPTSWRQAWPAHVWIGTSVENQDAADKRIPELLKIPAAIRFLSCEPLLSKIDLWEYSEFDGRFNGVGIVHDYQWQPSTPYSPGESIGCSYPGVSWVIVGGESGHHARPMAIEWAEALRKQCAAANVAFFMKQVGGHPNPRHELEDMPESLKVREFPTEQP